jgi:ribosomal protein S18 acetylase RimI-like enzyme
VVNNALVREYHQSDYTALHKLWLECNLTNAQRGDSQAEIEETLRLGGKIFIMEAGNEIIGTCWLTVDGRRTYLHHFGIKPGFQGKGYATKLMDRCLEYCRHLKHPVKIEVHRNNERAHDLYRKYGFEYLGDYEVLILRHY